MADNSSGTTSCVCARGEKSGVSEIMALQRFGELLRQQEQLLELLKLYTPKELITHLKTCGVLERPSFARIADLVEKCTAEELEFAVEFFRAGRKEEIHPGDLTEILSSHSVAEIKTAVKSQDRLRANRERYRASNREKINKYSANYMREYRAKPKQT